MAEKYERKEKGYKISEDNRNIKNIENDMSKIQGDER